MHGLLDDRAVGLEQDLVEHDVLTEVGDEAAHGLPSIAYGRGTGGYARIATVPDWSKKNFADIEDRSPEDAMQWRFARPHLGATELGVSRFTYEPGTRFPFAHRHREQEEAYVVVAGSGRAKLDDEIVELVQWDVLRVAPAVTRQFEAGPQGMNVICIGGSRPEGGDGERVEGFWSGLTE